ncbi:MAG: hypothetical protein VW405_11035, partial [Rhodospirillaceae bacterium]
RHHPPRRRLAALPEVLVGHLNSLKEIQARGSGVWTKDGDTLTGPALQTYIDQTAQRVDAIRCLSEAAADYEYRRTRQRN